jgi:hypothetical protein
LWEEGIPRDCQLPGFSVGLQPAQLGLLRRQGVQPRDDTAWRTEKSAA